MSLYHLPGFRRYRVRPTYFATVGALLLIGCHRSQSLGTADGGVSESGAEVVSASVNSTPIPINSATPVPTSLRDLATTIKTFKSKVQCKSLLSSATMPVALAKNTTPFFSSATAAKGCECAQFEGEAPTVNCSLTVTIAKRPPTTSDVMLDCLDGDGVFTRTLSFSADDFKRHEAGDKVRLDVAVQECWENGGVSLKLKIREADTGNPTSDDQKTAPTSATVATPSPSSTVGAASGPRKTCRLRTNVGSGLVQGTMCCSRKVFTNETVGAECPCSQAPDYCR